MTILPLFAAVKAFRSSQARLSTDLLTSAFRASAITHASSFVATTASNTVPSTSVKMLSTSPETDLPKVFFVLGGPGAGKGTQCRKLSSEYGLLHLSAGELLREERKSGSSQGKLIESTINEGKIVPSSITVALIEKAITNSKASRILLDGFPRNMDNLNTWNNLMKDRAETQSCIFIDCPETELERRILNRGLSSGRSDDTKETARKRFATYKECTLPVIEHFLCSNKLINIRGDQAEGVVWSELKSVFSANFI